MACNISFRQVSFTDGAGAVTISVTTDVASHLWARTTLAEPRIHRQPILRRGIAFSSDVRFCFTQFEDNEQLEPADTLTHTFVKAWWLPCVTAWLYFWGSIAGETCVSTSPIFSHHNIWVAPPDLPAVKLPNTRVTFIFNQGGGHTNGYWLARRPGGEFGFPRTYIMGITAIPAVIPGCESVNLGLNWTQTNWVTAFVGNYIMGPINCCGGGGDQYHLAWAEMQTAAPRRFYLRYQHGRPGLWSAPQTLFTDTGAGQATNAGSIAVDPDGYPHISYQTNNVPSGYNVKVYHVWQDSGGWHREQMASVLSGDYLRQHALAIAPDGTVHMVYVVSPWSIRYRTKSAAVWSPEETLPIVPASAGSLCIRVSKDGIPHVWSSNAQKYTKRQAGVWIPGENPSPGSYLASRNLGLDWQGDAYVSGLNAGVLGARVWKRTAGVWALFKEWPLVGPNITASESAMLTDYLPKDVTNHHLSMFDAGFAVIWGFGNVTAFWADPV